MRAALAKSKKSVAFMLLALCVPLFMGQQMCTPPPSDETILLPGNGPLEMVWIPAGTFMMGRYPGEQDS